MTHPQHEGQPMCAQGPRWLSHNMCGSTTSNCTVDDEKVTCVACLHKLREASKGPGTPYARWHHFLEKLERRFPLKDPFSSSKMAEEQHLEEIDALVAKVKDLEKANEAWGEAWSELHAEKCRLEERIERLEDELYRERDF